jgi:hypothetical protein
MKTTADYVREFHRQSALRVGGEPVMPATPQMAEVTDETAPEVAAMMQHYAQSLDYELLAATDEIRGEPFYTAAPAVSGLGNVASMDHRGGVMNLAPGTVATADDAIYETEIQPFGRGPKKEPTVGNANLGVVATMTRTGFNG